jgi:hypothetical protein
MPLCITNFLPKNATEGEEHENGKETVIFVHNL